MDTYFSEGDRLTQLEPEEEEGYVTSQCGDEESNSVFLQFVCSYMNRQENIHAGKLVSTLNKPQENISSTSVRNYVRKSAEINWARILENRSLSHRLDSDFNRVWGKRREIDSMVMVSAMFLYAQLLYSNSPNEETYVPRPKTSSATSWGLLAGLRRRMRGGTPYLHYLQSTRRGLVLAL